MVVLSFVCALILSVMASVLKEPQEVAKELDRSGQTLLAAQIYDAYQNYFLIQNEKGEYIPAKMIKDGILVPGSKEDHPSKQDVLTVYKKRISSILVDAKGNTTTFADAKINEDEYMALNKKNGYANLPLKLAYKILPNPEENGTQSKDPSGYIIPIAGFGLWDAIYGYLAIKTDGDSVIGISWYDQKETPGLGANIAEQSWQSQFPGKKIFQPDAAGQTDFKTAPLGITVVRGKVSEVIGKNARAMTAVDGMAGATLTGNGVTKAYKDSLTPYRPFLLRLQAEHKGQNKG